jgi:hypothetical protein
MIFRRTAVTTSPASSFVAVFRADKRIIANTCIPHAHSIFSRCSCAVGADDGVGSLTRQYKHFAHVGIGAPR